MNKGETSVFRRSETAEKPFAFELRLFGPRQVLTHDVPLSRLRARAGLDLLTLLALHPHSPSPRSWLAGTLWPESSEEQALYNLRRNLVDLRHALGDQAWRLDPSTPRTLRLDLTDAFCDVQLFDTLLQNSTLLTQEDQKIIFGLYRGTLLEGCTEEWIFAEREVREQKWLALLESLSVEAMQTGNASEAVNLLRRVVLTDPYRESAQRALMKALAGTGDLAALTLAYRELRLLLLKEFRSEPSLETQDLYKTLKLPASQNKTLLAQSSYRVHPESPLPSPQSDALPLSTVAPSFEAASPRKPLSLTSFIGRVEEQQSVKSALQASRLVTLTGPGGVGKTRLAKRVAEEIEGDFPEGILFVDLSPIHDGQAVSQAVVFALGLYSGIDATPEGTLLHFLGRKRVLLILDNGEQIADACAHLSAFLLKACSTLHILCTSRQPLYVPGERVQVLTPLSVPPLPGLEEDKVAFAATLSRYEAVAMLLDRVALTSPAFQLTANNALSVARVCRQLDGLPLALELVATLFRSLSVREIADLADGRLRLLEGGDPTLPRQRTLQAAIDWSYTLLNEKERTLLCRLSIFSGGWTLRAARAICAAPEEGTGDNEETVSLSDVLPLLVSLIHKSLVVCVVMQEGQEEQRRYHLLETTREFAVQHLSQSEQRPLQKRHADFFLRMVRLAETGKMELPLQDWLKQLWTERDNLCAAHALYVESEPETALGLEFALYSLRIWPVQNARDWIARLQHQSMPETALGVCISYTVASWAFWLGDPCGERLLKKALALACVCGENVWQMHLFEALTSLEVERGNKHQALEYAESTLVCAEVSGHLSYLSEYRAKVALRLWDLGESQKAQVSLQAMLREGRKSNDWSPLYYSLWGLGEIALAQGEYVQARAYYEEILPIAERYLPFTQSNLWRGLGWAACLQQDYSEAWRCLHQALEVSRRMHARDREGWTRYDMAEVAFRQGNSVEARKQLQESLSLFESLPEPRSVAQCLQKLSKFCAGWGKANEAVVLLASVERAFQDQLFMVDVDFREAAAKLRDRLRPTLDPVEWREAWDRGSRMTLPSATALAVSVLSQDEGG